MDFEGGFVPPASSPWSPVRPGVSDRDPRQSRIRIYTRGLPDCLPLRCVRVASALHLQWVEIPVTFSVAGDALLDTDVRRRCIFEKYIRVVCSRSMFA